MNALDDFAARLRDRLQQAQGERQAQAASVEQTMREREDADAQLSAVTEPIHRDIIRPLVEVLAGQFDNASVEHLKLPRGFATYCRLEHTPRFPAQARLSIGLAWDEDGHHAWLVADRDIVPLLMPFDATDRLQVSLPTPDEAAIEAWVEKHIADFVDAYLEVEHHPHYQQGRSRTDPVCGMHVLPGAAVYVAEFDGKTFHFCSESCRRQFAAEPARYLDGKSGPSRAADRAYRVPEN
jgi:YHS domain-containing protein